MFAVFRALLHTFGCRGICCVIICYAQWFIGKSIFPETEPCTRRRCHCDCNSVFLWMAIQSVESAHYPFGSDDDEYRILTPTTLRWVFLAQLVVLPPLL